MDYLKKKEELQNKINEINTYLNQKEELESKINEINTYWKDLASTHQKELKKRYDEYQEDKPLKKATGHLFYTAKTLLFQLKIRNLMYDDIYQHYEQHIFYCQDYKYCEQFYESYFLKFLYHLYKNEMIRGLTKYDKSFYMAFMEELKQKETMDKEIKDFIDEHDKFLIREKERLEEENTEEYKQKRELEKLEAELKHKEKVNAYSKYFMSVMK